MPSSALFPLLALQVVANPLFDASVKDPAYPAGEGPSVLFDDAHHNYHRSDGRYAPFVRLVEADGFRVTSNRQPFERELLSAHDVLVISSARGAPPGRAGQADPAFTAGEVEAVRDWVGAGGALLLITDHPPAATPPRELARAFGITLVDAAPRDTLRSWDSPSTLVFSRHHGTLADHPISRGWHGAERVDRVVTFTGNSIVPPPGAATLLRLSSSAVEGYERPAVGDTAFGVLRPAVGRAQGVALVYGAGRVVALGEAAAWTSQVFGDEDVVTGMDEPGFQNRQFILNAVRWLAGLLPEAAPERPAPDPGFEPRILEPTYPDSGPRVLVDGGHHNLFTADGRYGPLAALLAADGYRVAGRDGPLTRGSLSNVDLLVIAGPRGSDGSCGGRLVPLGRADCAAGGLAFRSDEISSIEEWVRGGGSLLLALDAFPAASAGADLARAFGVEPGGGVALDWVHREGPGVAWITFDRDSGTVSPHPVTEGVDRAVIFGGTSLRAPEASVGLLVFRPPAVEELPAIPSGDTLRTRRLMGIAGRAAAVTLRWERGRVVVLGDGDLITSQLLEGADAPVGLSGPPGYDNRRFARNLFAWLTSSR